MDLISKSRSKDCINILVVGVPNVGKSSIINTLRSFSLKIKSKILTNDQPGTTRSVSQIIKVSTSPAINVLDTPGILDSGIENVDLKLKYHLCNILSSYEIDDEILSDFLLFSLNRSRKFAYIKYFKLQNPHDTINTLLREIALRRGKFVQLRDLKTNTYQKKPDLNFAAKSFLGAYRKGLIGRFVLDD